MTDLFPDNMSVEIDHEKKRILLTRWSVVDKDNLIQSFILVNNVEGFDPSYDTLADYREVTKIDFCAQDFRDTLNEVNKFDKRTGRSAIVIGNNTGRLLFTKLICDLSALIGKAKIRYKAFRTLEEAETWLDSK